MQKRTPCILRKMAKCFTSSDPSFKLLVHHIRRLHKKSPSLGCQVLDGLLHDLQHCENIEWVGQLVATRIFFVTSHRDAAKSIEDTERVLSAFSQRLRPDTVTALPHGAKP